MRAGNILDKYFELETNLLETDLVHPRPLLHVPSVDLRDAGLSIPDGAIYEDRYWLPWYDPDGENSAPAGPPPPRVPASKRPRRSRRPPPYPPASVGRRSAGPAWRQAPHPTQRLVPARMPLRPLYPRPSSATESTQRITRSDPVRGATGAPARPAVNPAGRQRVAEAMAAMAERRRRGPSRAGAHAFGVTAAITYAGTPGSQAPCPRCQTLLDLPKL